MKTLVQAKAAGYDCGKNGADTENCHFTFFATKELLSAWEAGKESFNEESKPQPECFGKPTQEDEKCNECPCLDECVGELFEHKQEYPK